VWVGIEGEKGYTRIVPVARATFKLFIIYFMFQLSSKNSASSLTSRRGGWRGIQGLSTPLSPSPSLAADSHHECSTTSCNYCAGKVGVICLVFKLLLSYPYIVTRSVYVEVRITTLPADNPSAPSLRTLSSHKFQSCTSCQCSVSKSSNLKAAANAGHGEYHFPNLCICY
jgi:hypothetical protein